jgi:hypothetical protein
MMNIPLIQEISVRLHLVMCLVKKQSTPATRRKAGVEAGGMQVRLL